MAEHHRTGEVEWHIHHAKCFCYVKPRKLYFSSGSDSDFEMKDIMFLCNVSKRWKPLWRSKYTGKGYSLF
jgi:hypothetical protein